MCERKKLVLDIFVDFNPVYRHEDEGDAKKTLVLW